MRSIWVSTERGIKFIESIFLLFFIFFFHHFTHLAFYYAYSSVDCARTNATQWKSKMNPFRKKSNIHFFQFSSFISSSIFILKPYFKFISCHWIRFHFFRKILNGDRARNDVRSFQLSLTSLLLSLFYFFYHLLFPTSHPRIALSSSSSSLSFISLLLLDGFIDFLYLY